MTFLNVLNKFTLLKKKYLRANYSLFVKRELNKAVMQRSRPYNEYLQLKTRTTRIAKQRNVCVALLCKSKKPKNVAMKI